MPPLFCAAGGGTTSAGAGAFGSAGVVVAVMLAELEDGAVLETTVGG